MWYLGEDTKAYEGKNVSTEGSWEHGVDGAKAGVAMPGEPWVGLSYYQELYRGHAEDAGEVSTSTPRQRCPMAPSRTC